MDYFASVVLEGIFENKTKEEVLLMIYLIILPILQVKKAHDVATVKLNLYLSGDTFDPVPTTSDA